MSRRSPTRSLATVPAYAAASRSAVIGNGEGVLAVNTAAAAAAFDGAPAPDRNSYDYRVVLARRLYDRATATAMSPSLAGLAGDVDARVNPADADKISAPEDGVVRLTGARGSVRLQLRPDPTIPRGTVLVPFNRGAEINEIVDATAGATDVRIEQ